MDAQVVDAVHLSVADVQNKSMDTPFADVSSRPTIQGFSMNSLHMDQIVGFMLASCGLSRSGTLPVLMQKALPSSHQFQVVEMSRRVSSLAMIRS